MATVYGNLPRVSEAAINPPVKVDVVVDSESGKVYVRLTLDSGTAIMFDGAGVEAFRKAINAANQVRSGHSTGQAIKLAFKK